MDKERQTAKMTKVEEKKKFFPDRRRSREKRGEIEESCKWVSCVG